MLKPYDVAVMAASQTKNGHKLITFVTRYPRFIHGEVMTHKKQVRNASSSRAVPFKTMLKLTRKELATPVHWGKNKPGMSASEELSGFKLKMAQLIWAMTGHIVLFLAGLMFRTGIHKQVINRMIEPWTHISTQITVEVSELKRIYKLRTASGAQPEIQKLYRAIYKAAMEAEYRVLGENDWHLPWTDPAYVIRFDMSQRIQLSAARSARLSYAPHGSITMDFDKDLALAERLWEEKHLSPFEHPCRPRLEEDASGPFEHWTSYRTIQGL